MARETERSAANDTRPVGALGFHLMSASEKVARAIESIGIDPRVLVGIGFVLGLGASACLAAHANLVGLLLFLLNRAAVAIVPRMTNPTRAVSISNLLLGRIALMFVPFGLALADASHALAACFLILSLSIEDLARHFATDVKTAGGMRQFTSIGAVDVFGVLATVGLSVACLMTVWFALLSYVVGAIGFVFAGLFVAVFVEDRAS
jgi:hypothetical protein